MGVFALRLLRIPEDIGRIQDWGSRDYAAFWGLQGKTIAEVESIYRGIVSSPHVEVFFGLYEKLPMFLVECYRPAEEALGKLYEATSRDRGLHILVGPAQRRIPQFTWYAFTTVLDYLFSNPDIDRIVVEPDVRNRKIQLLNERAGFVVQKTVEIAGTAAAPAKTALLSFCTRSHYVAAQSKYALNR